MRDGHAILAGKPLAAAVTGKAEGPALLYLRPGEVVLTDDHPELRGTVAGARRTATGRRLQVKLHEPELVIDVETATAAAVKIGDAVGLKILRGRVFSRDQ